MDADDRGWPSTFEPIRSLAVLGGLLASVRAMLRWVRDPDTWEALAMRVRGRIPSDR